MASPIAHSLAGATICLLSLNRAHLRDLLRRHWRLILLFAILGNLPDFDFLLGWLTTGDPNEYHHGWTHSLSVTAVAAFLVALIVKIRPTIAANWLWFFAAIGSHILIDFFTGPELGLVRGYGMPLLWPFSIASFQGPISLVVGPKHHEMSHLLSLHNWIWGLYEAAVFGTILLLVNWTHRSERERPKSLSS